MNCVVSNGWEKNQGVFSVKRRLGEILVQAGAITEDDLRRALDVQRKEKGRLGAVLVDLEIVTESRVYEALAEQMGLPLMDLDTMAIDPSV
ncbi:unnamed protein product, partial [marine sediment metagenome]